MLGWRWHGLNRRSYDMYHSDHSSLGSSSEAESDASSAVFVSESRYQRPRRQRKRKPHRVRRDTPDNAGEDVSLRDKGDRDD